jgi:hypothetical protein
MCIYFYMYFTACSLKAAFGMFVEKITTTSAPKYLLNLTQMVCLVKWVLCEMCFSAISWREKDTFQRDSDDDDDGRFALDQHA